MHIRDAQSALQTGIVLAQPYPIANETDRRLEAKYARGASKANLEFNPLLF
jgi:hypothetical protein